MADCDGNWSTSHIQPWPTRPDGGQLFRHEWWGGCPECSDDDYWCGTNACKKIPDHRASDEPRCQGCGNFLQGGNCPWLATPPEEPWAECRGCGCLFPVIEGATAWDESDPSVGLNNAWGADCLGCGCYPEGITCHGEGGSCEDEPAFYEIGRDPGAEGPSAIEAEVNHD